MARSKVCFKCGQSKSEEDFYKHKYMGDGRLGKCKDCTKKDVRAHRLANLERIREYDRRRGKNPERKAVAEAYSKKWRSLDKRRMKCHNAVRRAIVNGKITRGNCKMCGSEKTVAHHPDYDYPLDIVWLCQPCHVALHKRI